MSSNDYTLVNDYTSQIFAGQTRPCAVARFALLKVMNDSLLKVEHARLALQLLETEVALQILEVLDTATLLDRLDGRCWTRTSFNESQERQRGKKIFEGKRGRLSKKVRNVLKKERQGVHAPLRLITETQSEEAAVCQDFIEEGSNH